MFNCIKTLFEPRNNPFEVIEFNYVDNPPTQAVEDAIEQAATLS